MFGGLEGALAGGSMLGQFLGQREANQANTDIANNANAMSQANAREQMQFQERMANTTHAREVADLKAAGLNPILSVNAGSPAPSGASGSTTSGNAQQNTMGGLASSAMEIMRYKQEMAKQDAELKLMDSQRRKTDVEAHVATKGIPEADLKNSLWDKIRSGMSSGSKILDNFRKDWSNTGRDRSFKNHNNDNPSYKLKRAR